MQQARTTEIVDLCSGGSGPWKRLQPQLAKAGFPVTVTLTDKYPAPESIRAWEGDTPGRIRYLTESVDATNLPPRLTGMRTLFEGFHHFPPEQARAILKNAAEQREAIGIFDARLKMPTGGLLLLLSPFITVLSYLLMTPFIRPRTVPRFLWTYLVPIVPLVTCWDGIMSLLRVYSPSDLETLADSVASQGYHWEAGLASTGTPIFDFSYLIGYPE